MGDQNRVVTISGRALSTLQYARDNGYLVASQPQQELIRAGDAMRDQLESIANVGGWPNNETRPLTEAWDAAKHSSPNPEPRLTVERAYLAWVDAEYQWPRLTHSPKPPWKEFFLNRLTKAAKAATGN